MKRKRGTTDCVSYGHKPVDSGCGGASYPVTSLNKRRVCASSNRPVYLPSYATETVLGFTALC
jgi:hypothetical protein